jgi:hypothetical protein
MKHWLIKMSRADGISWTGQRFAESKEELNDLILKSNNYTNSVYSIDKCPGCVRCLPSVEDSVFKRSQQTQPKALYIGDS